MTMFPGVTIPTPLTGSQIVAGTGGSVGAGSAFGSFAVVGGLVQAGINIFQQFGANKALAEAAEENARRINDQISDRFKGLFRQQTFQSRSGLSTLGRITSAMGRSIAARKSATEGFEGGGDVGNAPSGITVRALYSQVNRDIEAGAKDIKDAAMNDINALRQQREAIIDQAESQQRAPILAAVAGATQGALAGAQLGGAIDANKAARVAAEQNRQLRTMRTLANVGQFKAARSTLVFSQNLLNLSQQNFQQQQTMLDLLMQRFNSGGN